MIRVPARLRPVMHAVLAAAVVATLQVAQAPPARAAPIFHLPFPAGTSWQAGAPHDTNGAFLDFGPMPGGSTREVVASAAGTVVWISCGGSGYLGVDHGDGWQTRYYHLVNTATHLIGQHVPAGTRLGDAGQATPCGGRSTFVHVHFSIYHDGEPVPADGRTFDGYTVHAGRADYYGTWTDESGEVVVRAVDGAACCLTSANIGYDECPMPPPDGSLVRETNGNTVAVMAGGTPFSYSSPTALTAAGHLESTPPCRVPDGWLAEQPAAPADGTVLQGLVSGGRWVVVDGARTVADGPAVAVVEDRHVTALPRDGVATGTPADRGARLAGASRVETSTAIARATWPDGADTVYLARADDPADALVAGTLSDGPVLLVGGCGTLPESVADTITALAPARVVALGGQQAVCDSLVQQAAAVIGGDRDAAAGADVRLAGRDRFETAARIVRHAWPDGAGLVHLARADDPADAVVAATLTSGPTLLGPSCGDVPATLADVVGDLSTERVVALGGSSALCPEMVEQFRDLGIGTGRLTGITRYQTAARIALRGWPDGARSVYLARADHPADAVAAGTITDGPVLLVPTCGDLPVAIHDAIADLAPDRVVALGGPQAVCSEVHQAAKAVPRVVDDEIAGSP